MTRTEHTPAGKPTRASFHIPSLDGFRATAFLLVFMGHVGVSGIPGGFGVTVFFFLSGYLITTLLRMEAERARRVSFKLFYLRRVLRILPPFYLVLGTAVALTLLHALDGQLLLPAVLAQALHYCNYWGAFHGFGGIPEGTAVYWSLAIEEHFYAIFPALYVLLLRAKCSGKTQRLVFFGLCACILIWRCVLVFHFHVPTNRTYLTTDTRCDSLLMGCALAVAGSPTLDGTRGGDRPSSWRVLGLVAATALLLLSFIVRDDRFRETLRYTIQGIALSPLFYAAIRFPKWGPFPLFNLAIMRFLGKLSYSLYLVHEIVIGLAWRWLPFTGILRSVVALLASLAISWGIWLTVEKPTTRLRKRLEAPR